MDPADIAVQRQPGEQMLLCRYERDRDFEAPWRTSECGHDSALAGDADYALDRGVDLGVDIEDGTLRARLPARRPLRAFPARFQADS